VYIPLKFFQLSSELDTRVHERRAISLKKKSLIMQSKIASLKANSVIKAHESILVGLFKVGELRFGRVAFFYRQVELLD
jgi:hypothetical protein